MPDNLDASNTLVHRDAQGNGYGLGVAPFVLPATGDLRSELHNPQHSQPAGARRIRTTPASAAIVKDAKLACAHTVNLLTHILVQDSQSGTAAGNQQMLVVFAAGQR